MSGTEDRDFDARPYSAEERRVCDYLQEITKGAAGCGDDPVGFLIASHRVIGEIGRQAIDNCEKGMAVLDSIKQDLENLRKRDNAMEIALHRIASADTVAYARALAEATLQTIEHYEQAIRNNPLPEHLRSGIHATAPSGSKKPGN